MDKFYTVDIAGRKEDLPIIELKPGLNIAFFNLHGNQNLTEYCGKKIAEVLKKYNPDVLITAESMSMRCSFRRWTRWAPVLKRAYCSCRSFCSPQARRRRRLKS